MLNARLYRTCWLVAGVAFVVALLTLESPDRGPTPALPASIDGQTTLQISERLAGIAPERPAGSEADLAAARVVQDQFAQLPGMGGRVQVQEFEALADGTPVRMQNVYLVVPGQSGGGVRGSVLVVAPRDTPPGVAAGASSTAIMLQMARQSVTTRHLRPHLFLSTDGNTIGSSGLRWFLSQFSDFAISAVVVLDGVGDAAGDRIHVWSRGADSAQALQLARVAEGSIGRAGGRAEAVPGLGNQVLRLAVPQTFGDQGAAIAAGIPAVTLAGRPDSPLRNAPAPTAERLTLAANAAADLLAVLDQPDAVERPDADVGLAGRIVRSTVAGIALLLLALPILVLAVDALAGARRDREPLRPGLRSVVQRALVTLFVLLAAHLLVLVGIWPGTAAGALPLPGDVGLSWAVGLGAVVLVALVVVAARAAARRRPAWPSPAEGPAALLALSVLLIALWFVNPFALVLALPGAHALLLASAAERMWQVRALVAVSLAPLVILVLSIATTLDRDPAFAAWYLVQTTASGARGALGPLLGAMIVACLWSLAAVAAARVDAIANPQGPPRRRRPRVRLRVERVSVGRRHGA